MMILLYTAGLSPQTDQCSSSRALNPTGVLEIIAKERYFYRPAEEMKQDLGRAGSQAISGLRTNLRWPKYRVARPLICARPPVHHIHTIPPFSHYHLLARMAWGNPGITEHQEGRVQMNFQPTRALSIPSGLPLHQALRLSKPQCCPRIPQPEGSPWNDLEPSALTACAQIHILHGGWGGRGVTYIPFLSLDTAAWSYSH